MVTMLTIRRKRRLCACCVSLAAGCLLAIVVHTNFFKPRAYSSTGVKVDMYDVPNIVADVEPNDQPQHSLQKQDDHREGVVHHEYWPGALWPELQWIWQQETDTAAAAAAEPRTMKILYWTPSYKNPIWFGLGKRPFQHCPLTQCEATNDTSTVSSSDAIMIHQAALKKVTLPKIKLHGQLWVLNMAESPIYDTQNWATYRGLFEVIADYRVDADIPRLPGYFAAKPIKQTTTELVDYTKGKDKRPPVAWFVSHCKTQSEREKYGEELKKHIEVDVYGKCGTEVCQRPLNDHSPSNDPCMDMLHKEYKFYLSFENSLCRDYITEKTWLIYVHQMNTVPVVLGGSNYTRFFPPRSYIDILDFPSPRHLAQYLLKLNSDDKLYNQYFAWREKYEFVKAHTLACGVCSFLHRTASKAVSAHRDLAEWKSRRKHCLNPNQYYKNRLANV